MVPWACTLVCAALLKEVTGRELSADHGRPPSLAERLLEQEIARSLTQDTGRPSSPQSESWFKNCPEGYPKFGTLGDLLRAWNPNEPDVPEDVVIERLQILDYNNPEERLLAEKLRDCEVPFKLKGFPEAIAVSEKWTNEYLLQQLETSRRCNVMRSESNRFMFWHRRRPGRHEADDWSPPTQPQDMSFAKWLNWTMEADRDKIGPTDVHYYLTTGVSADAKTPPSTGQFVADDLPFFSTTEENFFITDVEHQKGIQCRFGARGIIAESHFDHGKNFVLMLRGRKRYLLNPPEACPYLGIIAERDHPSFRHSRNDWSDESDWPEGFAEAPALETVLEAGELLYIPSFWYHYIVSESFNVQCNARSGLSMRQAWVRATEQCLGREITQEPGRKSHKLKSKHGVLRTRLRPPTLHPGD